MKPCPRAEITDRKQAIITSIFFMVWYNQPYLVFLPSTVIFKVPPEGMVGLAMLKLKIRG